jgi:alcohol dehydrogenase class IV
MNLYAYAGSEPALEDVQTLITYARDKEAEFICGIGGGSILDLAKAAAALFYAPNKPVYYLYGNPLERPGIPFIAVPTTAGTGSEATVNSVITNPVQWEKLSIRDDRMIARTIILDGELLEGLPPSVIAESGMDAFTQGLESFLSNQATDFTRELALRGLDLVARQLMPVYQGAQGQAAGELLLGSCLIGMALTTSRLGVVHGVAHPLGVYYNMPHGKVCAACLVPALKLNRPVIEADYRLLSERLGNDLTVYAEETIRKLGIINPFKGKPVLERERIIDYAMASGSTKANPLKIGRAEVEKLLDDIF